MPIGCIIQARLGSTRLPGKVMMKVDEKNPVLYYVIKQLQECRNLKKIIVATTQLQEDLKIVKFVEKLGLIPFQGNPTDVLDRYYQCAKIFSIDPIVRITADCPLIDPTIVDHLIEKHYSEKCDYACMHLPRTFPRGTDAEVFSFKCLELAWKNAKKSSEREHVTPFFYNNPEKFKIFNYQHSENLSKLKWSVDRETDLNFVKEIISRIEKRPILTKDILQVLKKEPRLLKINSNSLPEEGYKKSLQEDRKLGY